MIRRRVCDGARLAPNIRATFSAVRYQSGLHTFIRDSKPSNFSSVRRSENANGDATASPGATAGENPASSGDWASHMQRELFGEVDPLGGQAHKDYYRDVTRGYSPQYAPRNFANGGAVAYPHIQSPYEYEEAAHRRVWLDHDVDRMREEFTQHRASLRSLASAQEREELLRSRAAEYQVANTVHESESVHPIQQLYNSGGTSRSALKQQAVADRYSIAEQHSPLPLTTGVDRDALDEAQRTKDRILNDSFTAENLLITHGLREKEKHDFTILQRTVRIPFQGYDMDRFLAQQKGTPYGAQQLPPNVVPSSMEEAQRTLRGSSATATPLVDAVAQKVYARNTVVDRPAIGEQLTEQIINIMRASRTTAEQQREEERAQRFGLGRQGALVQDGGPDQRTLKKHTNDERIVDAMLFQQNAYRKTPTDEHWNPYIRRSTENGVGHLLQNKFDIMRREDRLSKGEQDLTERNTIHYGVPIQQIVDEFVFRHRNARGERPLDYFKPFPNFRALRLNRMYRDVEGFSLMKQRPEFLEWELFTRYRQHHQQRRRLALLHGLEPVANETAQERDTRRHRLDEICERTPFDEREMRVNDDEMRVSVETLRSWFGVYMLPSPTVVNAVLGGSASVNLHLYHLADEMGTADTREHVLSSRYLNRLLLLESYQNRVGRGFMNHVVGRAPEPVVPHEQPQEVLRHFSAEERAMYEQHVKEQTSRQLGEWERAMKRRRWLTDHQQYGHVVSHGLETSVVDLSHTETGAVLTVSTKAYEQEIEAVRMKTNATIKVDGMVYNLLPNSERRVVPLTVQLDSGEKIDMTSEDFDRCELEAFPRNLNHALNYGIANYAYNRGNYVETQDSIWEEQTASGQEGWSPATHADGLREGLPVRARRPIFSSSAEQRIAGGPQRAVIIQYHHQPFFNPEPRLVKVAFQCDGTIMEVPISDVMIWQRRYHGPERTVGDESRRYNPAAMRRYVDVTDPFNEKTSNTEHFLDKYEPKRNADTVADKYRTTKQITEIDKWTRYDSARADNYRPLSISHRRDYIRMGYIPRYTPWEWIAIQEADQPLIAEQIRQDNIGTSYFFSLNRYWRYKASPHGYIRHFENEVRDLLQYVDGVTPWKQAQKIRTYWEVRSHHPMPQFNRPEVAMHRNTVGLLPAHMWETDKKTGKVKSVKDSVRDYQTKTPYPKWVQL
uniref:ms49 n=1 Tax=Trypanosoma brucei brucei TaxID=5702 RepID=UPI000E6AE3B8|nr:Chain DB, ms49 [Trypanosoma brucei brucei]6HIW_DB Chain DB, mS49 [Trypanosoma brucei brucei]6HIZ_DB Chain DB, mS49 [Trypanosoma brucei brucei]6SG9_DB Chain DB, mS49 [Trypanosoma brucei brucei]6SGB_DB Chain DB, mS49 [Trypanosoma brucei brucei]7PUA_DB Chain DB, mS49 [Trypanosoma brucei brucei]7PUB_DB Chain DB, mS49 [Trypanosoma brucei brucei]